MKRLRYFKTLGGKEPFKEWLRGLKDPVAKTKIVMRLDRLSFGNPGDHAPCRSGVWELRVDQGPGYRIYYALEGPEIVLILLGGDKKKQQADINQAVAWWEQHQKGREYDL
ncbi:type II toxin-antitoxin system RelE/ParE family toxin [Enterobacteriaceae bacterium H11S18]|uniref:type II toxin-antitoxin system RelE/ParE family toxin n=1 Tax=Dryocola clanedunensis TaxID=2925396 RepID=UPI0022F06A0C|nr:type II toxin-antitoxin system RelE/ParE family toxin [Dryocola clanedunensis]MCT4704553.1 type II toxin-antitoxin system RelE/ParE family toxin [Dryocola clanedunensis]MCT4710686.1 type II toxin-antitoxin system RelE/ParE family toxin [Dryocola clanedunensis]